MLKKFILVTLCLVLVNCSSNRVNTHICSEIVMNTNILLNNIKDKKQQSEILSIFRQSSYLCLTPKPQQLLIDDYQKLLGINTQLTKLKEDLLKNE